MGKYILTLFFVFGTVFTYAQCQPNSLYQDSTYNIWPDTIINLPQATQGAGYSAVLDIKTPSTLIEASGGDSSLTVIDTLGQSYYIGDWPVDSMELVSVSGLPLGLSYGCDIPTCVLPGDFLSCAYVNGTVDASVPDGIYPITILVNVYTHGELIVFGFPVPVNTDLYSALGAYEEIPGYKINVGPISSINDMKTSEYVLLQNTPNPSNGSTVVEFISPSTESMSFKITDMLGKKILTKDIYSIKGINKIYVNQELKNGIYFYSISNNHTELTKRMVIAN